MAAIKHRCEFITTLIVAAEKVFAATYCQVLSTEAPEFDFYDQGFKFLSEC